jgi:hypothetical protein
VCVCVYVIEYYSAINKNEIMSLVRKWMELVIIMLSEVSQVQKAKYRVFICLWKLDLN